VVRLGKAKESGFLKKRVKRYAVKFFRKTQSGIEALEREKEVLRRVKHPNVISSCADDVGEYAIEVKGANGRRYDSSDRVLVLPYVPNGDMLEHISDKGPLGEELAKTIFLKVLDGVEAIHANGVIHRDLKPENILLDKNFEPIICDFGFSALCHNMDSKFRKVKYAQCTMRTKAGSKGYMAPEVLEGKHQSAACDIWSLGVCLFIFVAGFPPYGEPFQYDWWYRNLLNNPSLFWKAHERHIQFSAEFKELISTLLTRNPSERATIQDIRKSAWFQEIMSPAKFNNAVAERMDT